MRTLAVALVALGCGSPAHTKQPTTTPPVALNPTPAVPWRVMAGVSVEDDMIRLINEYRRAAGVAPVVLDPVLTKGCREHAEYMVINRGKPQLYSINAHHQDMALPGATPDGAACGAAANLYPAIDDLQAAVHGWMSSLFHRRPVIAPDLVRVGIGYAPLPAGVQYAVALRFVFGAIDPNQYPVAYPANNQMDVPIDFVREEPNPIPPPTAYAGYAFTLHFPFYDQLTNVSATLVDGFGKPVPFFLSSPEQPASPYTSQGANVGVIPKEPLRAWTRYFVTVNAVWNGRPVTRSSSWMTMQRQTIASTDGAALVAGNGKPALVRGSIISVSKITDVSLQLKLEAPTRGLGRVNNVVVEVLTSVLGIDPTKVHELKGQTADVEATPKLLYDTVYLTVTPVGVIRLSK